GTYLLVYFLGNFSMKAVTTPLLRFFDKEGIKMDDFVPAKVVGYSEWPKNTPNYWALPAMGDVVGWTYRKDWFEKPEMQKEFKEKYGHDLAAPKN
ncbi:hypothetical protein ACC717_37080, partial [Rhizobium ruizarguesonis]